MTTLRGSGTIHATGGGDRGGGGRVAVYAQDYSGFTLAEITAGAGGVKQAGAGTVYLRDTDDAHGTLVIDNGNGYYYSGYTPLGLPAQTSMSIPDAVVIRGNRTVVRSEHSGLVLDFQNTLSIDGGAQLQVSGDLGRRCS